MNNIPTIFPTYSQEFLGLSIIEKCEEAERDGQEDEWIDEKDFE